MEIFRFKRFEVRNERSAMKVNTDGVLLGVAMTLRAGDRRLLDIGTGTGTIALMAAQRLSELGAKDLKITAIDIDEASAAEAAENFSNSPWPDILEARHISLNDFERKLGIRGEEKGINADHGRFDVIFSNPPYFESSLKAPDERRRNARHAETMSYREIIAFASRHLTRGEDDGKNIGRLSIIIPYDIETEAVRFAASFGLSLLRRVRVRTTPQRPFSRSVLEFTCAAANGSGSAEVVSEELTIQNKGGYSDEYRSLVKDFLFI